MINWVLVIAKTEKGKSAIQKAYEESKTLKRLHRIKFKLMGFVQTIANENPYTLKIEITNNYFKMAMQKEQFEFQIKNVMKDNGAEESDYIMELG